MSKKPNTQAAITGDMSAAISLVEHVSPIWTHRRKSGERAILLSSAVPDVNGTVRVALEGGGEMWVDPKEIEPIEEEPQVDETPETLIEFTILRALFQGSPIQDIITQAFHFDPGSYSIMEPLKVTCRPDQFGLFIALLSMRGRNINHVISIRAFTPKPAPKPNAIDARYLGRP